MKRTKRTITLKLDVYGAGHLADWIQAGLDNEHFSDEDGDSKTLTSLETAIDIKAQLVKQQVINPDAPTPRRKRRTFKVLRNVDAYVHAEADVEAKTPEEAAQLAKDQENKYKWQQTGISAFDARNFVTLDRDGLALEETRTGDVC